MNNFDKSCQFIEKLGGMNLACFDQQQGEVWESREQGDYKEIGGIQF